MLIIYFHLMCVVVFLCCKVECILSQHNRQSEIIKSILIVSTKNEEETDDFKIFMVLCVLP